MLPCILHNQGKISDPIRNGQFNQGYIDGYCSIAGSGAGMDSPACDV
jgi:hypothetical protein